MKKILVVVAHPDDEVLGCGGTLLKSAVKGAKVKTIIVSEGVTSRSYKKQYCFRRTKKKEEATRVLKLANCLKVLKLLI